MLTAKEAQSQTVANWGWNYKIYTLTLQYSSQQWNHDKELLTLQYQRHAPLIS